NFKQRQRPSLPTARHPPLLITLCTLPGARVCRWRACPQPPSFRLHGVSSYRDIPLTSMARAPQESGALTKEAGSLLRQGVPAGGVLIEIRRALGPVLDCNRVPPSSAIGHSVAGGEGGPSVIAEIHETEHDTFGSFSGPVVISGYLEIRRRHRLSPLSRGRTHGCWPGAGCTAAPGRAGTTGRPVRTRLPGQASACRGRP